MGSREQRRPCVSTAAQRSVQTPVIAARNLGKFGAIVTGGSGRAGRGPWNPIGGSGEEEAGSGPNHPRVAVRLNHLALLLKPEAA